MNQTQETTATKNALKAAGLKVAKVTHGKGTACGWLHVTLDVPGEHVRPYDPTDWRHCIGAQACETCRKRETARTAAYPIIQAATGRSEYAMEQLILQTTL